MTNNKSTKPSEPTGDTKTTPTNADTPKDSDPQQPKPRDPAEEAAYFMGLID